MTGKTSHGKRPRRVSYLLRLWQVEDDGRTIWRVSLHDPDTGQRRGFTALADLLRFLQDKYGAVGAKADLDVDTV